MDKTLSGATGRLSIIKTVVVTVVNDATENDHWKEQELYQWCGATETALRAIKLRSDERDLLCVECAVEVNEQGEIHPDDPRMNSDGTIALGTSSAPSQHGGQSDT